MEKPKQSMRFESRVEIDGSVIFSKKVRDLRLKPGSKVTVKIFGGSVSSRLKTLGVSEDEIETIGEMQFEDRNNVVRFLSSQGILRTTNFRERTLAR